jgi:hypothetical protein
VKLVESADATGTLAEYTAEINNGPLVVTEQGRPVAVLLPIGHADLETVTLSMSLQFLALIERSRERTRTEGGIPSDEMRRRLKTSLPFVTYENRRNPHVTIHRAECGQPRKRGGRHRYGQGGYHEHTTYSAAREYADSTGLPLIICSYCNPGS